MNYKDHCEEIGAPIPTNPVVFSKYANAITHPEANIIYPSLSKVCTWAAARNWFWKFGKKLLEKWP